MSKRWNGRDAASLHRKTLEKHYKRLSVNPVLGLDTTWALFCDGPCFAFDSIGSGSTVSSLYMCILQQVVFDDLRV